MIVKVEGVDDEYNGGSDLCWRVRKGFLKLRSEW